MEFTWEVTLAKHQKLLYSGKFLRDKIFRFVKKWFLRMIFMDGVHIRQPTHSEFATGTYTPQCQESTERYQ